MVNVIAARDPQLSQLLQRPELLQHVQRPAHVRRIPLDYVAIPADIEPHEGPEGLQGNQRLHAHDVLKGRDQQMSHGSARQRLHKAVHWAKHAPAPVLVGLHSQEVCFSEARDACEGPSEEAPLKPPANLHEDAGVIVTSQGPEDADALQLEQLPELCEHPAGWPELRAVPRERQAGQRGPRGDSFQESVGDGRRGDAEAREERRAGGPDEGADPAARGIRHRVSAGHRVPCAARELRQVRVDHCLPGFAEEAHLPEGLSSALVGLPELAGQGREGAIREPAAPIAKGGDRIVTHQRLRARLAVAAA